MPRGPIFRVVVGSQIVAPPTVYKLKKTHTFKHIRKQMKIVCPLTFFIKLYLSPKKKKEKKRKEDFYLPNSNNKPHFTHPIAATNRGAWIL